MSRCGMNPIGDSPIACSRPTKNHTASPAITAVFAPAPNRGRMAAYTHKRPIPDTKSSATHNGIALSIALGCLPSACIAAAMSAFSHTPYVSQSMMFSTTPASSPPDTTRPQLILPIVTSGREEKIARRFDSRGQCKRRQASLPVRLRAYASSLYGTTNTATIPPSPSGIVATPWGTTQSDPSSCRLKWYNPRRSTRVPSQTSSPKGRSRTGCQAFQSPAIATERASGIRNRTTRLSPRESGTRGVQRRTAAPGSGRGALCNRTAKGRKPARGSPWKGRLTEPPPPTSSDTRGLTNTCREALPAAVEEYVDERRAIVQSDTTARPRSNVAPALASVNQPSGKCVGSTLSCTVGDVTPSLSRHHKRARVCRAVTGRAPEINPVDGPAASPAPQVAADHRSSPTACAAPVGPALVRVVPAKITSTPSWRPPAEGAVAADRSAWPNPAHSPPGSEAIELERSATSASFV